mmetsp:Transcript_5402/g.22389  ORF Transcript_5402/g.22389 Transcript_5402/m.22389 type:complete len:258 (+) Transcript_5402:1841-2614(+)
MRARRANERPEPAMRPSVRKKLMTLPTSSRWPSGARGGAAASATVARRPFDTAYGTMTTNGAAEALKTPGSHQPLGRRCEPLSSPASMHGTKPTRRTESASTSLWRGPRTSSTSGASARPAKSPRLNVRNSKGTKSRRNTEPAPSSSAAWPRGRASAVSVGNVASVTVNTATTDAAGTATSRDNRTSWVSTSPPPSSFAADEGVWGGGGSDTMVPASCATLGTEQHCPCVVVAHVVVIASSSSSSIAPASGDSSVAA